jgi:hypothetical protein
MAKAESSRARSLTVGLPDARWRGTRSVPPKLTAGFSPRIRWIVEERGVRVYDAEAGELFALEYPEAAVWDLLSRDPRGETVIPKLAAVLGWSEPRARRLLRSCADRWADLGVLRKR